MIFMATTPSRKAKNSKKKPVVRKPRKTVVSVSAGVKKKKPAVRKSSAKKVMGSTVKNAGPKKKNPAKKVVVTAIRKPKPATDIMVPRKKRVVRRPAMAEMQQRASVMTTTRKSSSNENSRSGAMQALLSYGMVLGAFVGAVVVGAFVIRVTNAADWQGPSGIPPAGNMPVTVWNSESNLAKQTDASIDIDGTISAGHTSLDLGAGSGGQNLLYGYATFGNMHATDKLLKLESEAASVWTERFSVDKDGDAYISGRVGIGTAIPGAGIALDADGDVRVLPGGRLRIANSDTDSTNTYLYSDTTGTARSFGVKYTSAGSPVFYIDSGGKAGIGSSAPGYKLDVVSDSDTAIVSINDTNASRLYTGMRMARTGTEHWFVGMNASDENLQMRATVSGIGTDVVTVTQTGDVTAKGSITAEGCFGASYVGVTPTTFPVSGLNSYFGINNKCELAYSGSHACSVNEMLESLRCSVPTSPIRTTTAGEIAWINGGPPGFTADSNDCIGWSSSASSSYGRYWAFDNTTGGFGTMTSCNVLGLKVACCI